LSLKLNRIDTKESSMRSHLVMLVAALAVTSACSIANGPTAPDAALEIGHTAVQPSTSSLTPASDESTCSFDNGTTTCVSVSQTTETTTHQATSGCLYGPTGIPSRRTRTFLDTILVTTTTTILSHGHSGAEYSSSTEVTRQLQSSRLISDVCEPPA
jgi:hypothetical protein